MDEQRILRNYDRVLAAYQSQQPIPPHDLALLLHGFEQLHAELIRTRLELRRSREQSGAHPLLL